MADEPPSTGSGQNGKRNGNLAIPLPFDEAVKAALEVKPEPKKPRKSRAKKSARK